MKQCCNEGIAFLLFRDTCEGFGVPFAAFLAQRGFMGQRIYPVGKACANQE
jgi:hypothetical protein